MCLGADRAPSAAWCSQWLLSPTHTHDVIVPTEKNVTTFSKGSEGDKTQTTQLEYASCELTGCFRKKYDPKYRFKKLQINGGEMQLVGNTRATFLSKM